MNLFVFCNDVHFIHRSGILYYLSFPVSLTSFSMITSSFFPLTGNGIISSFFMSEQYCIVYIYPIFCIHSSVLVHISCFPVLAIVPSLAMIFGVQVS